jgi:hypothetical protein
VFHLGPVHGYRPFTIRLIRSIVLVRFSSGQSRLYSVSVVITFEVNVYRTTAMRHLRNVHHQLRLHNSFNTFLAKFPLSNF